MGNKIRDARIGFEMIRLTTSSPSTWLESVTFSNNFIGLSNSWALGNHKFAGPNKCVFEGGGLKPGYAGQIPTPNSTGGFAGMKVINRFSAVINETNTFNNLYNGLVVCWMSKVKVTGARFKNIQYDPDNLLYPNSVFNFPNLMNYSNHQNLPSAAINVSFWSTVQIYGLGTDPSSNDMFFGCRRSISNFRSRLDVTEVKIDGEDNSPSEIGIYVLGNSNGWPFNIQNNRIRTNGIGICLLSSGNQPPNNSYASNNNITVLDNYDLSPGVIDPSLIKFGIISASSLSAKGIVVENNTVNLRSWNSNTGIFISSSNSIVVKSNLIRRYNPSQGSGIYLQNNQEGIVNCNSSIGMESNVMSEQNEAFNILSSPWVFLGGNHSNFTKSGFAFNGISTQIAIHENDIGEHLFESLSPFPSGALHLGNTATLGEQADRFNRFLPSNGFAFKPVANTSINRFTYHISYPVGSVFVPQHLPADNDCSIDFFFKCSGNSTNEPTEPPCGTYTDGSSIPGTNMANTGGTATVATALINGQINYPEYDKESKFDLSKSIAQSLEKHLLSLPNSAVYQAWQDSLANSNAAKLNAVNKEWNKENTDNNYLQLLQEYSTESSNSFDYAMQLFATITQAEDFDSQSVIQNFQDLYNKENLSDSLLENLKIAYEASMQTKIDSANYWNNLLSDPLDYETMEKDINNVFLNTIGVSEFSFNSTQKEKINEIAFQCPSKSSAAVYRARELYLIDHPFTNFNNYTICSNQNIQYRLGETINASEINVSQKLNQLQINITGQPQNLNYRLFNCLGQLLYQWQSSSNQQNLEVTNILNSSGMYILHTQNSKGNISTKKFIYNK